MGDNFDRVKYYHEYFRNLAPSDFNVDRFVDMIIISNIGPRKININEADPKTGTGKKPKGSGRRLYTDEDPTDTVKVKFSTRQDIVDTLNKKSFKSKSHARQSQIINLIHQRVRAAYNRAKDPAVKKRLKTALDYAEKRKEASKKKTQRLKKQKMNEMGLVGPGGVVNGAPDPKTVERFKKYGESGKYGSGMMLVKENMGRGELIKEFIKFTSQVLELKSLPKITLTSDKSKTQTYAHNDIGNDHVVVYTGKRSLGDILRSLGHEIIHYAQKYDGSLDKYKNPGATGTPIENEANAGAGILLRNFGKMYPQIFE